MDIVFDQRFPVVGEELPVSLGFENVIFVMEDVDAASPIVKSRDRAKQKRNRGTKTTVKVSITIPQWHGTFSMALEHDVMYAVFSHVFFRVHELCWCG